MDLQTTIKFVKGEGWDPQIVDPQGTNALTATTSDPLFWVCAVLLAVLAAGVAIYFITKRRAARNALAGAGSASSSMHYNAVHARHAKPQSEKSNIFKKALIVIGALLLALTLAFAVSSRDSIKALANDAGFSLFGNTATTTNTNAEGVTVPETILGYVSADGKVTIDNAPITNNNDDFIEFYKSQLSEMKGVGNSTWKFSIQKADGTKVVLFEGKVGDAAQSTWARLDKGETGTLIIETDITADLALQLIDSPTVQLSFNSMYHPVTLDINVSAGVNLLDKDGNVLSRPIKAPSNEDFIFRVDDGHEGNATVVKVNGQIILPDEEGNYTIDKETLTNDPTIEVTKYLFVLAKLNGGAIKQGSSVPTDWNIYSETEGLYYKLYAAGPSAASVEREWAHDNVKVTREGYAQDGWNTNIPETGAVDNSYIEMKWATSTKEFDPSSITVDDDIVISDKDNIPYDEGDYPIPMKDGEDFTFIVKTDNETKKNDEIVVVISDETGTKEIVADPDGKVTIPDGDKDKEWSIKFKFAVVVDLGGGAVVAGTEAPTDWTPSATTPTKQYTKKILSGTTAEDIEAEWALANKVHVKHDSNLARDGWTTDITEKGLQKSGERCTMTWLSAEESSTINIAPDKDGHVVITDTDGNEYVAGDFPIAVKNGDDFEYKVKINGETDDAKVKFVDDEGHEVTPDDEGVFKITGGDTQAKITTTITYPAIVDLSGGSINEEKLPEFWKKVTEANGDKYQKYFDKGTPAHRVAATDPAGVLDEWGTAVHKVKYEGNAFQAWVDSIPATGIAAKTTESITWASSSHDFDPHAKDVDDGITISDKDKNPYETEDYPIPMVDDEDFVIHVNPTDPEKTDEIVVVIGDDPATEVTPGEGGKVTIKEEDKDKEIKIKYKYVVTVDLNGASILPAGGNPPTGWTKSEATSSNQYTKKFLSGTSAETVENEWSRANKAYVKFEGRARNTDNPWETTIGTGEGKGQGLQANSSCTMQWLTAENSTTITFPSTMDENLIICDTDGNEYSKDEFPLAVSKDSEFKFKVKIKDGTETEDAKILVTDKDDKEIEPVDDVYTIAIEKAAIEVHGYITYPVYVNLTGGEIAGGFTQPEGWEKDEEATETDVYYKYFAKHTLETKENPEDPDGYLDPWTELVHNSGVVAPEGKSYSTLINNCTDSEVLKKEEYSFVWQDRQYSVKFKANNSNYGSVNIGSEGLLVPYKTEVAVDGNQITVGDITVTAFDNTEDIEHTYTFKDWTLSADNSSYSEGDKTLNDGFEPIKTDCTFVANFEQSAKKYNVYFDVDGGTVTKHDTWTETEDSKYTKQFDYGTTSAAVIDDIKANFTVSKTGHDINSYNSDIATVGLQGKDMNLTLGYEKQKYTIDFAVATPVEEPADRGALVVDGTTVSSYQIKNVEYDTPYTITTAEDNTSTFEITVGGKDYKIISTPNNLHSEYNFPFEKWTANDEETSGKVEEATSFAAHFDYALKKFNVNIDFTDGEYEFTMGNIPAGWELVEEESANQPSNIFTQIANWFTGKNDVKTQKYTKVFDINTSITNTIVKEWDSATFTYDEDIRVYRGIPTDEISSDKLRADLDLTALWRNAYHNLPVEKGEGVTSVKDSSGKDVGDNVKVKDEESVVLKIKTDDPDDEAIVYVNGVPANKNNDGYFVSEKITDDNSKVSIAVSYAVYIDFATNGGDCTSIPEKYTYQQDGTHAGQYKTYFPRDTLVADILGEFDNDTIVKEYDETEKTEYKFKDWTVDPVMEKLTQHIVATANFAASKFITLNIDESVTVKDTDNNKLTTPVKVFDNETLDFKVEDSKGGMIEVYYGDTSSREKIDPSEQGVYTLSNEQIKQEKQIIVEVYYKVTADIKGGSVAEEDVPKGWTYDKVANNYYSYFEKGTTLNAAVSEWTADTGLVVSKTGYHYVKWTNLTETINENISTEIEWDANTCNIVFHNKNGVSIDGDSPAMVPQTFEYGDEKALSELAYVYTGHHFLKWYTDGECKSETTYTDKQTIKINEVVSELAKETGLSYDLYADWAANTYSIEFNANYGDTPATITQSGFVYGKAEELKKKLDEWDRDGYTFLGWSKDKTATTATYTDGQKVTDVCTTNEGIETLYAIWRAHTYTVKFEGNGSTAGTMETQTFTYDEAKKLSPKAYTRTGYTWTKWTEDAETPRTFTDEEEITNLTTEDEAEITLKATWDANNYKIYVYPNHGEGAETAKEVEVTYDAEYSIDALEREGYDFRGFYKTSTGSDAFDASGIYTTAGDTTVYGCWQIKYYQLYFQSDNTEYGDVSIASTSTAEEPTIPYNTPYYVDANNHLIVKDDNKTWIDVYIIPKEATTQYTYNFLGWYLDDEKITSGNVSGHHTYIAKFERVINKYTATLTKAEEETITWTGTGQHGWTETTTGFKKDFDYGTAYADILNGWEITSSRHTAKGSFEPGSGPLEADQEFTGNFEAGIRTATISTSLDGDMIVGSDSSPTTQTLTCNLSKTSDTPTYEWSSSQSDCLTFDDATSATPTITAVKDCEKAVTVSVTVTSTEGTYDPVTATKDIIVRNGTVSWSTDNKLLDKVTYYDASGAEQTLTNGQRLPGGTTITVYNNPKKYYDTFWDFYSGGDNYDSGQSGNIEYGKDIEIFTSYYTGRVYWHLYSDVFDAEGNEYIEDQEQWLNWGYKGWTAQGWSKEGYTFEGCYTNRECTGDKLINSSSSWAPFDGTIIDEKLADKIDYNTAASNGVFCHWVANNYTIAFDAQGGVTPNTIAATYDQTYTAPDCTRTGYTFKGWAESEEAAKEGTVKYAKGAELKNLSSKSGDTITLYAVWTADTHTITFNKNADKAEGTMAQMTITYGDDAVKLTTCAFKRTGYTFAGWATASTGAVEYADGAEVSNLLKDLPLYAVWTPVKFSYIFNGNGNTDGSMTDLNFDYDDSKTFITLTKNAFVKENYKFKGWDTSEKATTVVYEDEEELTQPTEATTTTLYAVWENIPYYIEFDGNGASAGSPMKYQTINLGDFTQKLNHNSYRWDTDDSCKFLGWSTNKNATSITENDFVDEQAITHNLGTGNDTVTLYAIWKEKADRNLTLKRTDTNVTVTETGIETIIVNDSVPISLSYSGDDDGNVPEWTASKTEGKTGEVKIVGSNKSVAIKGKTSGDGAVVTVKIDASDDYKAASMTFPVTSVSKRLRNFNWNLSAEKVDPGTEFTEQFSVIKATNTEGESVEPDITVSDSTGLFTFTRQTTSEGDLVDAYKVKASSTTAGVGNVTVSIPGDDEFEAFSQTYTPTIKTQTPTISVTNPPSRVKVNSESSATISYTGTGTLSLAYVDDGGTESTSSQYITGSISGNTLTLKGTKAGNVKVIVKASASATYSACQTDFDVLVNNGTRTLAYKDADNSEIWAMQLEKGETVNVAGYLSDTLGNDSFTYTSSNTNVATIAKGEGANDIKITAVSPGTSTLTITVKDNTGYYADKTVTISYGTLSFKYTDLVPGSGSTPGTAVCSSYVGGVDTKVLEVPTWVSVSVQAPSSNGTSTIKSYSCNVTEFGDGENAVFDSSNYATEVSFAAASLALGGKLTTISENAFSGITQLNRIQIPSTCTTVESNAFNGCTGLKYVVCDGGTTNLASEAFANCSALTSFVVRTTSDTSYSYASDTFTTSVLPAYFILAGGTGTSKLASILNHPFYTYTEASSSSGLGSQTGKYYYLIGSNKEIKLSSAISINSGLDNVIDLNGHVLTRNKSTASSGGNVITTIATRFRLDDSSTVIEDNMGQVTGGYNSSDGGGIIVGQSGGDNKAKFILANGKICGNKTTASGGGVQLWSGRHRANKDNYNNENKMYIYGGCISGNTASSNGGGINTHGSRIDTNDAAVIVMNGGKITGNTATNGGGIYLFGYGEKYVGGWKVWAYANPDSSFGVLYANKGTLSGNTNYDVYIGQSSTNNSSNNAYGRFISSISVPSVYYFCKVAEYKPKAGFASNDNWDSSLDCSWEDHFAKYQKFNGYTDGD